MSSRSRRQFRRYEPKFIKERDYANAVRAKQKSESSDGDLIQKNQGVQPQQYYVNHRKRTAWSTAVRYGYHIKSLMSGARASRLVNGASVLPIGNGPPLLMAVCRRVARGYSSGNAAGASGNARSVRRGRADVCGGVSDDLSSGGL